MPVIPPSFFHSRLTPRLRSSGRVVTLSGIGFARPLIALYNQANVAVLNVISNAEKANNLPPCQPIPHATPHIIGAHPIRCVVLMIAKSG